MYIYICIYIMHTFFLFFHALQNPTCVCVHGHIEKYTTKCHRSFAYVLKVFGLCEKLYLHDVHTHSKIICILFFIVYFDLQFCRTYEDKQPSLSQLSSSIFL
jgi:hypothetical protein